MLELEGYLNRILKFSLFQSRVPPKVDSYHIWTSELNQKTGPPALGVRVTICIPAHPIRIDVPVAIPVCE